MLKMKLLPIIDRWFDSISPRLSSISLSIAAFLAFSLFALSVLLSPNPAAGVAFENPFALEANPYPASLTTIDLPAYALTDGALLPNFDDDAMLNLFTVLPSIVTPGHDLSLGIRARNTTTEPLHQLTVEVHISPEILTTRSSLADWIEDNYSTTDIYVGTASLPDLSPNTSGETTLRIPLAEFPELTTTRGPRPLSVVLRDHDGSELSHLNSFFIFDPLTETAVPKPPIELSFIAPVTGALAGPTELNEADDSTRLLANSDRLDLLLGTAVLAGHRTGNPATLSLAVDPALVALAAYSDDDRLQNWANQLTEATNNGLPVYALPPFDPDLAALAHADLTADELYSVLHATLPTDWSAPGNWHSRIAWPADWLIPDLTTIQSAATNFDLFLVPAGLRARFGTTTGIDAFHTSRGNVTLLVNDDRLASSFVGATTIHSMDSRSLTDRLQQFLAELTIIADQYPENPPHLLIALPRNWDPNPTAANIAFSTITDIPWLNISPLNQLMNQPVPTVDRFALPAMTIHEGELAPDEVRQLIDARANLAAYISAAVDSDLLISRVEPRLMLPLSQGWREYYAQAAADSNYDYQDLSTLRTQWVDNTLSGSELITGTMQLTASGLTLISDTGVIPLNVHNGLPSPARVRVVLTSNDTRLLVEEQPLLEIPEGATLLVYVPVTAIASGDVLVSVELQTEDGEVITRADDLQLRIRAGWETVSTGAVAILLGVMLLGGIYRTIKKNKKRGQAPTRERGTAVHDPQIFDRAS